MTIRMLDRKRPSGCRVTVHRLCTDQSQTSACRQRQCVSWRFWDTLHQLCIDQSQTCACTRRRWRPQRLSLNRCYEVRSSCQVRTSWSTVLRSPDVDAATAHCLHRMVRGGPLPNVPRDVLRPLTLCARTSMFPTSVNTLIASPRLPRHSPPAPHRPIANPCM